MYELAWRIDAVRVILNTQVAVALVFSLLLVLWLWRRELAAGATVLVQPHNRVLVEMAAHVWYGVRCRHRACT